MISIVYLPGELNTLADGLSREEKAGGLDQMQQGERPADEDTSRVEVQ